MSAVTPNRTRSVYSHLEVSVYYALLMAILHRRHNLPSDRWMGGTRGERGEGERKDKNNMNPWKWYRGDLAHKVARRCWRATPGEGKRQIIRTSEPKAVMSSKKKKKKKKVTSYPEVTSRMFSHTSLVALPAQWQHRSQVLVPPTDAASLFPSTHEEGNSSKVSVSESKLRRGTVDV